MRAAAVQLNSMDDKGRNLAAADRLTREAAADGADARRAAGEVQRARHPRGLPGRRRAARRPDHRLGARDSRASSASTSWPGSIVERRDGRDKLSNTSVHVGPDGELKAVYRKIHMFDVEVGGQVYRESESPGGRPRDRAARAPPTASASGMTVCYDLRFPELYRALAVEGARVLLVPGGLHQGHRRGALGDPDPRPRDREPGLRGRGRPGRPAPARQGQLRRLDDRRPMGRGPRRARPTRSASWPPTSTSSARTRFARSCPASPTACPTPTAGPAEVGSADGHRPAPGAGGQAPR